MDVAHRTASAAGHQPPFRAKDHFFLPARQAGRKRGTRPASTIPIVGERGNLTRRCVFFATAAENLTRSHEGSARRRNRTNPEAAGTQRPTGRFAEPSDQGRRTQPAHPNVQREAERLPLCSADPLGLFSLAPSRAPVFERGVSAKRGGATSGFAACGRKGRPARF